MAKKYGKKTTQTPTRRRITFKARTPSGRKKLLLF